MKRLSVFTLSLFWICSSAFAKEPQKIYLESVNGTVYIEHLTAEKKSYSGSGVLIDKARRLVATNYHVVIDQTHVNVYFPARNAAGGMIVDQDYYRSTSPQLIKDGTYSLATVIACRPEKDLAILQLESLPASAIEIPMEQETTPIAPRDRLLLIGNPKGRPLWRGSLASSSEVRQLTMTFDDGYSVDFLSIAMFGSAYLGNSGGPVLNEAGNLVGITESAGGEGGLNANAVHLSELRSLLHTLKERDVASIRNATDKPIEFFIYDGRQDAVPHEVAPGKMYTFITDRRWVSLVHDESPFPLNSRKILLGENGRFAIEPSKQEHYVFQKKDSGDVVLQHPLQDKGLQKALATQNAVVPPETVSAK